MTHIGDGGLAVAAVGGLLYIALGVWVLTLTPRRRQTTLLGAFAILLGLASAPGDLLHLAGFVGPDHSTVGPLEALFSTLADLALLGLVWSVPKALGDRRVLGGAVAVASLFLTLNVFDLLTTSSTWAYGLGLVGAFAADGAFALLALRAGLEKDLDVVEVRQLGILALGTGALRFFAQGGSIPLFAQELASGGSADVLNAVRPGMFSLLIAGLWGWNMVRAGHETRRIHRAVMLAILGLLTAGAITLTVFPLPEERAALIATVGVVRTLGVGLLAYGILRHDLAGLDAKVEWGLSKTTVAGIFVAVFFVVSEGAQTLFADVAGSELLGVIAAGLLVFAISPLQRLADRFAAKAVPGGAEAGADAEKRYRRELEMALADGEVTRDEERQLGRRAAELDIDAQRARQLRGQVEAEIGEGRSAGD